jgi:hypothetical protein
LQTVPYSDELSYPMGEHEQGWATVKLFPENTTERMVYELVLDRNSTSMISEKLNITCERVKYIRRKINSIIKKEFVNVFK